MKIEVKYAEPKTYFPKEVIEEFFNGVRTINKGMRVVFCKNNDLIINNNNREYLACIEMIYSVLCNPNGDVEHKYYLMIYSKSDKSHLVLINKNEYDKLFEVNDDDFLSSVYKIINKGKKDIKIISEKDL